MLKKQIWSGTPILLMIVFAFACQKSTDITNEDLVSKKNNHENHHHKGKVTNEMVLLWNEKAMKVLVVTAAAPPILSRHAAMIQIAVHDALNTIKPKYKTYATTAGRNQLANENAAIISAAYWTFKNIDAFLKTFPPGTTGLPLQTAGNDWNAWYDSCINTIPAGAGRDAGITLGKAAADAIMLKRSTDNYALARVVYQAIPAPLVPPPAGVWRPTISQFPPVPPYHTGGLSDWATYMKSISGISNSQFRPGAPPLLTSSIYLNHYNEVKSFGARTGSSRTTDQSQMANFWQEGPVTIWNRFYRSIISGKNMDAWKTARLLALANTSIFDGFLTSFDGLYYYKTWRPETAVRLGDNDGNDFTSGDAGWLPFVTDIKIGPAPQTPTPPLPEYPNPNTVVGSASVLLLNLFFETNKTDINLTSNDPLSTGIIRNFKSFSQAGDEYFMSRIYAGYNFRFSLEAGDKMGKSVSKYVFNNLFTKIENDDDEDDDKDDDEDDD